jgi:hypothetical protein
VSIKVICLRLLVLSFNCQRARADIVSMYLFFLTLDGLAFDHFPLSLVTFTLHISGEISRCYYKEILGDSCQFLFQQQSSLVRFVIMWVFFYFRFSHFC